MVVNLRHLLPLLVWSIFSLSGCNNDIFGLFGSTDLDIRWQARNTFNFLSSGDRNIPGGWGDEYSFIVLSDTHIDDGNTFGLDKLTELKDVKNGDVKFVVINGDITQNGKRKDIEAFKKFAGSLKESGVYCYPVAGNHDIYFGNWPEWEALIGSTCYRINGGGTTLLIMDSANAYFGAKQLDWLEDELKKAKGRVFVFTHANLFVESPVTLQQFTDVRERARVTSLLKGRCDAMFTGHVHERIVKELGGVRYITTEDFRSQDIYCQVWVSQKGIRWEFRKL
jgi:predicted phosphodiesterase